VVAPDAAVTVISVVQLYVKTPVAGFTVTVDDFTSVQPLLPVTVTVYVVVVLGETEIAAELEPFDQA
jgi:hypothetical protein